MRHVDLALVFEPAGHDGAVDDPASRRGRARGLGVDHVLIDDGDLADRVREIVPDGVDGAVELVGVNTLRAVRPGGTVCFTRMLSDEWTIPEFYLMGWLSNGVRLTVYVLR